eukprot:CAMPEP_0198121918 /NCGR_PEP_ID=MMETSP1442-20131203/33410_1 /TAXON_ID= /ORGANISM="Craspedostauros australis, Strain CCMP3328" /LENGTH=267 /DNA_ID=CAMNT_0043780819 /DNA_START=159 /DNA_END=963 /DNA_ORIENTATION=+
MVNSNSNSNQQQQQQQPMMQEDHPQSPTPAPPAPLPASPVSCIADLQAIRTSTSSKSPITSGGVDHGNAPHNERERGSDQDADTPDEFICPLTLELMNDPLMDRMGINFEREAIMEWLNRGNNSCPLTRKPLSYSKLVPNAQLRLKIDQWKKSHNIPVVRNTFPAKIQNLGGTFDVADKSSSLEGYHAWQDRQLRLRMMEAVAFDAVAQVSGGKVAPTVDADNSIRNPARNQNPRPREMDSANREASARWDDRCWEDAHRSAVDRRA